MSKRTVECANCGKGGHIQRDCRSPIMSFGCIGIQCNININECLSNSTINWNDRNLYKTLKPRYDMIEYIKFSLINRRDTIGYMEFIRGKYDLSDIGYICKIFSRMKQDEITRISDKLYLNKNNHWQVREISDIGLYKYNEAYNLIREYHKEKRNVLQRVFVILSNIIYNHLQGTRTARTARTTFTARTARPARPARTARTATSSRNNTLQIPQEGEPSKVYAGQSAIDAISDLDLNQSFSDKSDHILQ